MVVVFLFKQIRQIELRAGILPTVLMISMVWILLCSALISVNYYRNLLFRKHQVQNQLMANAASALEILKSDIDLPMDIAISDDLYGYGQDSIFLRKWGLFDIGIVEAFRGHHYQRLAAMSGAYTDSVSQFTLYLTDENQPLLLAGNTHIKGKCALPVAGIRTVNIEGKGFSGQVPDGTHILKSNKRLPIYPVLPALSTHFWEKKEASVFQNPVVRPISELPSLLNHSFFDPVRIFTSAESYELKGSLAGNILLHSDRTIVISASARLKNVIIAARKVIIREGFRGQLQIFAQDTLIMEQDVFLRYPSTLCIQPIQAGLMEIGPFSTIEGVLATNSKVDNTYLGEPKLFVHENAQVWGQVYCNGLAEWRGKLSGSLMCRRFSLLTPSAFYENHLLDADLNVDRRPVSFLTSPSLSSEKRNVLIWLK